MSLDASEIPNIENDIDKTALPYCGKKLKSAMMKVKYVCFPNLKNVIKQIKKLNRNGVNNVIAKPGQDTCSHTFLFDRRVSLLRLLVSEESPLYPPYPYCLNSHPSLVVVVTNVAVLLMSVRLV